MARQGMGVKATVRGGNVEKKHWYSGTCQLLGDPRRVGPSCHPWIQLECQWSGATCARERPNLSGLRDSIRSANLVDTYGPTYDSESDVSLSAYHATRHGLSMFQWRPGRFSNDCECRLAPASNLASVFVRVYCATGWFAPTPPPSKREFWRCTLHVRTKIVFQGKPW